MCNVIPCVKYVLHLFFSKNIFTKDTFCVNTLGFDVTRVQNVYCCQHHDHTHEELNSVAVKSAVMLHTLMADEKLSSAETKLLLFK